MLFDDAHSMTVFSVPFFIAMAAPGWNTIILAALCAVAMATYVSNAQPDSVSALLGVAYIALICFGFGAGIVTRSVTLLVAPATRRPLAFFAVMALGYALPLVWLAGPSDVIYWLTRPSLATCAQASYRVRVGDVVLTLPPAPAFKVWIANGRSDGRILSSSSDRGLRALCREGYGHDKTLGPAALIIDPGELPIETTKTWLKPLCQLDKTAEPICLDGNRERPARWIETMQLYGEAQRSGRRPLYALEQRLTAIPRDFRPSGASVRSGSFDVYPDGLRVANGPEWRGSDGFPFRMTCEGKTDALFCTADDKFSHDVSATMTFRTTDAVAESDAAVIRGYLRSFLATFGAVGQTPAP